MNKIVFNIAICIMGILILGVHLVNLIIKKNKRIDEKWLLAFIAFTIFHFSVYLCFSFIRINYSSNELILTFYTVLYIMNNIEVLLLFMYMIHYNNLSRNKKMYLSIASLGLFFIFVILDFVNLNTGIFFTAMDGHYVRSSKMILSQGYQFFGFVTILIVTLLSEKSSYQERIAFSFYCILPLIAIIVQNIVKGYAVSYAAIVVSVEILFFYVNYQKSIELSKAEEKNKDAQIKIMLSQIQPHFIYNSLSSISTLITIDSDKAQQCLDEFTDYLRMNLTSLTETKLIPFKEELRHIKTYVNLEQMRFSDRLKMIYDIGIDDFFVPSLTIQPLVENAIKHGVMKKIDGGQVTLTTYETDEEYVIEIKDDGVGFDISKINFDENAHFGLKNITYRINQTCDGDLKISSRLGEGTKITVKIKK